MALKSAATKTKTVAKNAAVAVKTKYKDKTTTPSELVEKMGRGVENDYDFVNYDEGVVDGDGGGVAAQSGHGGIPGLPCTTSGTIGSRLVPTSSLASLHDDDDRDDDDDDESLHGSIFFASFFFLISSLFSVFSSSVVISFLSSITLTFSCFL